MKESKITKVHKAQDIKVTFNGITLPDAIREIVRDMIPEIKDSILSLLTEDTHECPPQIDGVVSVSSFELVGNLLVLHDDEGKQYIVQWPFDLLDRLADVISQHSHAEE